MRRSIVITALTAAVGNGLIIPFSNQAKALEEANHAAPHGEVSGNIQHKPHQKGQMPDPTYRKFDDVYRTSEWVKNRPEYISDQLHDDKIHFRDGITIGGDKLEEFKEKNIKVQDEIEKLKEKSQHGNKGKGKSKDKDGLPEGADEIEHGAPWRGWPEQTKPDRIVDGPWGHREDWSKKTDKKKTPGPDLHGYKDKKSAEKAYKSNPKAKEWSLYPLVKDEPYKPNPLAKEWDASKETEPYKIPHPHHDYHGERLRERASEVDGPEVEGSQDDTDIEKRNLDKYPSTSCDNLKKNKWETEGDVKGKWRKAKGRKGEDKKDKGEEEDDRDEDNEDEDEKGTDEKDEDTDEDEDDEDTDEDEDDEGTDEDKNVKDEDFDKAKVDANGADISYRQPGRAFGSKGP